MFYLNIPNAYCNEFSVKIRYQCILYSIIGQQWETGGIVLLLFLIQDVQHNPTSFQFCLLYMEQSYKGRGAIERRIYDQRKE